MKYLLIILFSFSVCYGQKQAIKIEPNYTNTAGSVIQIGRVNTESYVWDSDFTRYETGLVTALSDTIREKINEFVIALKDSLEIDSLAEVFDVMYILANETAEAALRNLVKRAHDATVVNAPVFTAFEGYVGAVTGSKSINTNYNGRTEGVNYTLNSAAFGVYIRDRNDYTTYEFHGVYSTTADGGNANRIQLIVPNNYYNNYGGAINSGVITSVSSDKTAGMYIGSRTASNLQTFYLNNTSVATASTSSTKIPNQNVYLLALLSINSIVASWDNDQISFAFLSKGLNTTEIRKIINCFEVYMDSNGEGVIP